METQMTRLWRGKETGTVKYVEPELAALPPAVEAIQSSTAKAHLVMLDTDQEVRPVDLATSAAYEADE